MMDGLVGKSVVISGGAQGIGLAGAELLLHSGANVAIADINDEVGKDAVAKLNAEKPGGSQAKAIFVHVDVTDEASVAAMVDSVVSEFGKLDGAINQAVYTPQGVKIFDMTVEQWDRSHAVNLRGQFLCTKHQINAMAKNGGGAIVAISSTAAVRAVPTSSDYCAMKAGVNGMIRAACLDALSKNVRVNAVMPGATDTPGFWESGKDNPDFAQIRDFLPMKRLGKPEEVASAAVWMLSDYGAYTNGIVFAVDGALTAF